MPMASEPNQKMDEQLKRYAKQRQGQAGGPFELHPATRNLLQGEVARRTAKAPKPPAGWFNLLSLHWPRFALAGGLATLIFVGLIFWSDSMQERKADAPYDLAQL